MANPKSYVLDEDFIEAVAEVIRRFQAPVRDGRFHRRETHPTTLQLAYLRLNSGTGTYPATFTYDLYNNQSDATAGTGTPLYTNVGLASSLKRLPANYLKADDGTECWYRVLPEPSDSNKPKAKIVILGELVDTTACADTTGSGSGDDDGDGGDM